jgi:hypothetical protein
MPALEKSSIPPFAPIPGIVRNGRMFVDVAANDILTERRHSDFLP